MTNQRDTRGCICNLDAFMNYIYNTLPKMTIEVKNPTQNNDLNNLSDA